MSQKIKHLLIMESLDSVKIKKDDDGNYVFEGIFGEIGVKNKNGRIYDENQYLPQIGSLQEKITQGALLGELDHPEKFEVSLQKASHMIESLEYDKDSKQVRGRIKLLDTRMGRDAKALVDAGVPLHISSRAAGVVESNGHVKIKQLFTYDLVADPGFANAQLTRVNESFGLADDDKIQIFEVSEEFVGDTYTKENNSNRMENEYIKSNDFDKWSKYMSEQVTELKAQIETMSNDKAEATNEDNSDSTEKIAKLEGYIKYLSENLNKLINHNDYIIEGLNSVKQYSEYVGKNTNENINYSKYLHENMETMIKHQDHIAENSNSGLKYGNYVGEELEKAIKYIEHVAKGSNEIKEFTKYLGENTNNLVNYAQYLRENMNEHVGYSEYLKKNIEHVGNYSNYLGETFNGDTKNTSIKENKTINENNTNNNNVQKSYKDNINDKLQQIIESAEKQKADDSLHFMKFLSKDKQDSFISLDAGKQSKVLEAFSKTQYFSSEQATQIFENALIVETNDGLDFVRNMPDEYRDSFEKLTEARKNQIIAESNYHNLNTPYQVTNFWQTRDLRETTVAIEKIEENAKPKLTESNITVDGEYAKALIESVKRLNNVY